MKIRALATSVMILAAGCDDTSSEPKPTLAPEASTLTPTKEKAPTAATFAVQTKGSKIELMMEAPKEKIRGRVADAMSGEIGIDLMDLTKTTAHLKVDIGGLELFQAQAAEDGTFGPEQKSDLQNEHARTWLEISDDAPEEVRTKNRNVEFVINSVTTDTKDVTKLTGDERKVTFTVTGDFLLHGRKSQKTAKLEGTFRFDGDKPKNVEVKTVEPFAVGLAEHDVHPRESFGKLAQKTLEVLAPKVAKEAQVSVSFTADLSKMGQGPTAKKELEGEPAATGSAEPADSAQAAASASAGSEGGETQPAASPK